MILPDRRRFLAGITQKSIEKEIGRRAFNKFPNIFLIFSFEIYNRQPGRRRIANCRPAVSGLPAPGEN